MKTLSLVVPCFNEEKCIEPFVAAVDALGLGNHLELVFVDDGSRDGTLARIKAAAADDARVRYVSFSRNFGKEAALLAGLRHATGELVVTMDADLQHRPELLKEMLKAIEEEGYDAAAVCRTTREGGARSWFAHRFYALMSRLSEVELRDGMMDFRMMTRQVVNVVLSLGEAGRFTKGIYQWVGFRTKWIEAANAERTAGASKWSLKSLFAYSLRGFVAFSAAPLQLATAAGAVILFGALVGFLVQAVKALAGSAVSGCTLLALGLFALGGLQLLTVGILGLYVAGISREAKRRPAYVVKEQR